MIPLSLVPRDLEHWRGRHLQLAALALTGPIAEVHWRLATLYSEQIAAIVRGP